ANAAPGKRRDVDVVALLERDPLAVRRRHDLVRRREGQVLLLVAAIGLDGHERRAATLSTTAGLLVDPEDSAVGPERWPNDLAACLTGDRHAGGPSDRGECDAGVAGRRGLRG